MDWRFRKSFSPIPGVRLTLSPSGITTSVGVGPFRIAGNSRGSALTVSIPGTGLSVSQPFTAAQTPSSGSGYSPPPAPGASEFSVPEASPPHLPSVTVVPPMHDIKSASSTVLTSAGLSAYKQTLETARQQFATVESDLADVRAATEEATSRYRDWAEGWLFRRIMKHRFSQLRSKAEESQALQRELEEHLELSRLNTQFEMPDDVAKAYSLFADEFAVCSRAQRIWDNVAYRATNKTTERTIANRVVDLKPVKFGTRQCGIIQTAMPPPYLENANGGDIYVYPGFVVYHASTTNYALIEFADVELKVECINFHEEKAVPGDARQVGTTWAKTNKDGSPDRRFKDNYPIPIMEYAQLTLKSPAGLNEEYILSNVISAKSLELAWKALRDTVRTGS